MAMTNEHKDKLRCHRVQLVHDLDTTEVLEHLYADEVITMDMKDQVLAEKTRQAKASALLDILPRRGDRAYGIFCMALRRCEQNWLADLLER